LPDPLICGVCGDAAFAVKPGAEPEIAPGGIVTRRGRPDQAWCFTHWPQRASQRDLFAAP
jgi:hypothetical protein